MLPRYHLTYQQRQTQTRLSIPTEEKYATILQPPQVSRQDSQSMRADESSQPQQQIESGRRQTPVVHSARAATPSER